FSGGERKRFEVLQALVLKPKFAIFDEIDSGLDVDALRDIARQIKQLAQKGAGVLIVTHYQRILKHLTPNQVHVMVSGKIVKSGGPDLAARLEEEGYRSFR
ncbi:MAG: ABC transporter ATP-binding protein, Fe-S cluster assembly ATP-binding protein, partial [candidate division CPR1 bacterium GW2011_GWC1_49_13]